MPRSAIAPSTVDDELSMSRVDDLIQRGRSQGHLSLSELRTAFGEAGLTPAEGRSILRELSEAGVQLANEVTEKFATAKPARKTRTAGKAAPATRGASQPSGEDETDMESADSDGRD